MSGVPKTSEEKVESQESKPHQVSQGPRPEEVKLQESVAHQVSQGPRPEEVESQESKPRQVSQGPRPEKDSEQDSDRDAQPKGEISECSGNNDAVGNIFEDSMKNEYIPEHSEHCEILINNEQQRPLIADDEDTENRPHPTPQRKQNFEILKDFIRKYRSVILTAIVFVLLIGVLILGISLGNCSKVTCPDSPQIYRVFIPLSCYGSESNMPNWVYKKDADKYYTIAKNGTIFNSTIAQKCGLSIRALGNLDMELPLRCPGFYFCDVDGTAEKHCFQANPTESKCGMPVCPHEC